MKRFLLTVSSLAIVSVASSSPVGRKATSVSTDGAQNGVEFTTANDGSIRFDAVHFKPNATGDGFDTTTSYNVLALQPDGFFLKNTKNENTEVDYIDGPNLGMDQHTAVFSLEHGWLYAKRTHHRTPSPVPPNPPDDSGEADDPMQVDPVEAMLIGPHWPIVIIRDIGAGAEGTEMLVVRRRDWNDQSSEFGYVLMMEGADSSYVWALNRNAGNQPPDDKRVYGHEMDEVYLLIRIANGGAVQTVERRYLFSGQHKADYDKEAKFVRDLVLERRAKNRDKFWNPGAESY